MRGSITRRGKASWRIKFDMPGDDTAGRVTRYITVRGKRQDAERELTRLVSAAHDGTLVEPSRVTLDEYLRMWIDETQGLAGKTRERYRQLVEQQILPHLGALVLQKLRPAHIASWHAKLLKAGGKKGSPLTARTVGHAHRVLHCAVEQAVKNEIVSRNVVHVIAPPRVEDVEVKALTADQIAPVLAALKDHRLEPIAVLALSTGARRGEILALTWENIDLVKATMRIERKYRADPRRAEFQTAKDAKQHPTSGAAADRDGGAANTSPPSAGIPPRDTAREARARRPRLHHGRGWSDPA